MNTRLFNFFKFSLVLGFVACLISAGILKAQRTLGEVQITDRNGKPVVLYQESHALVIWAGNYKHPSWLKLNNVEEEAKQVVEALKQQGFEVTIVGNPTGEEFKRAIDNFIASYGYKPNNRLVIFYTGHGNTRPQNRGYLVPVDAPDPNIDESGFLRAAISMERVMTWAREIEAKHVLFVFDSCFSGTLFKTKSPPNPNELYISTIMDKPVRQFLTAGDAGEKVPAKSVFTPLFIRAIEGEADHIKDGYVTGNELGLHLTQNLSKYTKSQSPQYGKIRDVDLDRGDIVFRSLTQPIASPLPSPGPERPSPQPTAAVPQPTHSPLPRQPVTTLISKATGIDYTELRNLLAAGKWKEADIETSRAMLQAAGREKEGWLSPKDIDKFSCEDLRIIDQLWLDSSKEKFGFSVQKEVYESLGGTGEYTGENNEEVLRKFSYKVGWTNGVSLLRYSDLTFNLNAPKGQLPYPPRQGELMFMVGFWGWESLLSHNCL